MTQNLMKYYIQTTDFLGRALGPDYEVAFYAREAACFKLVAIANNRLSGREIGAPLDEATQKIVADQGGQSVDYRVHYRVKTPDGRRLRCSAMLIRNEQDSLVGLLCVYFDDSRYQEISELVMGLCHPDAFVETSFLFDAAHAAQVLAEETQPAAQQPEALAPGQPVQDLLAQLDLPAERLTQREKMDVVRTLERRGVFRIKGTVRAVAAALHCSPASIYRYLGRLRDKT